MMFASLFRRLTQGFARNQDDRLRCGRRGSQPRQFIPEFMALEERSTPSSSHSPFADLVLPFTAGLMSAQGKADTQVLPFKVTGGGIAANGLPLTLNTPAPHDATGTATHLGKYSAEGMFQLLSFTSATTGTFNSAVPVVFTAANGDKLAFNYAGTFEIFPHSDGTVHAVFTATFTPNAAASTGRFEKVTGGSFVMVATTEPFVLGSTAPTAYTWEGQGTIEFGKGKP